MKTFTINAAGANSRAAFYAAQAAAVAAGKGDALGIVTKRVFESYKLDTIDGAETPTAQAERLLAKTKFGTATSNAGCFHLPNGEFLFFGRFDPAEVSAAVAAHKAKAAAPKPEKSEKPAAKAAPAVKTAPAAPAPKADTKPAKKGKKPRKVKAAATEAAVASAD